MEKWMDGWKAGGPDLVSMVSPHAHLPPCMRAQAHGHRGRHTGTGTGMPTISHIDRHTGTGMPGNDDGVPLSLSHAPPDVAVHRHLQNLLDGRPVLRELGGVFVQGAAEVQDGAGG